MLQKFIDSITVDYDFHPVSCEYPYLKWFSLELKGGKLKLKKKCVPTPALILTTIREVK